MMNARLLHLLLVPALLLGVLAGPPAQPARAQGAGAQPPAAAPTEREQVASQLANVKRLLETSSGAQRVLASRNELAKKIREDALARYKSAEAAFAAGDLAAARRQVTEAARSMFQAVRMLGPAAERVDKLVGDFERRAESTQALLDALRRIAEEEGRQASFAQTVAAVEKAVASARALLAEARYNDARKLLDGGYEMAKSAVESLREGQTLVRSLHFESPEAEYRYELDRNDTHHMLVNLVVKDKAPSVQTGATIDSYVRQAGELRRQAEQKANAGAFSAAIELLEASTKELVRAIRSAGLFIPG